MQSQEDGQINTVKSVRYRRSLIRASILDYLRRAASHPSAEEVHEAVKRTHPKVSFGTVYRNLNILVDQGEAKRLESSRERDRFDARRPFHAHFRCDSCGRLYDLPLDTEKIVDELIGTTGHKVSDHQIDFSGICSSCAGEG